MKLTTTMLAGAALLAVAAPALAERELTLGMQDNEASNAPAPRRSGSGWPSFPAARLP